MTKPYKAMISSDWNGCLAPCGPLDCISFVYPHLEADLAALFRQYTSNLISLGQAATQIRQLLPAQITADQMDAYLDQSFTTYMGVPELIQWCAINNVLFMINTTGMMGYFQRILAKSILPPIPVISAHPMIRFPQNAPGSLRNYELHETWDKSRHTEDVACSLAIPAEKLILLGDSGGDGPHFEWGASIGAFLIGSMTKSSLDSYCLSKNVTINLRFGLDYSRGEQTDRQKELQIDFIELVTTIKDVANR